MSGSPTPPEPGRLKVAFDVGPLYGERTGIGNAVAWTLEALETRDELELLPYVTSTRARVEPPVRRLPLPAALAHRWWPHWSPPLDRLLGRPDVIHGTNYVVAPTRCARVVSVYDCWFLDNPGDAAPAVRRAGKVLRRAVDDGATVVASSEATAGRVRDLLRTDRVRTILLGPPPIHPTTTNDAPVTAPPGLGDLTTAPFLLALGTLERRKNIPLLIDAFARVAGEHETVRLVIAGAHGDDHPAVQRAIDRLRPTTAARVVLQGHVGGETKRWLLDNARALAYPSLDEGFGFPILEAQQAGLPVVASTAGSILEVAGSAALFSAPHDVDALAANLHWVLTSDDIRTKLITRGRTNVERFSWAATAGELLALYTDLADGATS